MKINDYISQNVVLHNRSPQCSPLIILLFQATINNLSDLSDTRPVKSIMFSDDNQFILKVKTLNQRLVYSKLSQ